MKIKIEREIWPQCISDVTKDTGEVMKNYFDKYKFAELIVRECMQVVHNGINNATDWDSSSWDQCCENRMYAIQKHFGVEE
jgi:hypothetical protein